MDDLISRQVALGALEKVAELYPWKVPGNRDSYSQYNEAWQDALDRAEGVIGNLPSAQPEIVRCRDCVFFPEGTGANHDLEFPEEFKCPCECEDYWYSWKPDDDWYCANGKRKENR